MLPVLMYFCTVLMAFEMNSGRILVQISSFQVFKAFLGFVDPREVTESPLLGSFSPCIPASGALELFPTTSTLPSPYTAIFPNSVPGGHRLRGEVQSCSFLWTSQSQREKASNLKSKRRDFSWNLAVLIIVISWSFHQCLLFPRSHRLCAVA